MDLTPNIDLFRNALLYTIAADTVRSFGNANEVQTILYYVCVLFILNAIVNKISVKIPTPCTIGTTNWQCGNCKTIVVGLHPTVTCSTCEWTLAFQKQHRPAFGLIHYLLSSISNIITQYESTMVARMLLTSLNQTNAPRGWIAMFAFASASLLWLLTTAFIV